MSIQQRRERDRAQRHQLIIDTARELAEAEGWEAVTTRRLAERIEYSQPVLYSHFAGKDAIVAAVAEQGFAELAARLAAAREGAADPSEAFAALAGAYCAFAHANPARYDAMFTMASDLPFGTAESPAALKAAFGELAQVFGQVADGAEAEAFTEVAWASLHGLVTLTRGGRLRPDLRERRLDLLVRRLLKEPPAAG
ncbi:TetR family transcriptional regulator [Kitasatospora herbaricolor]|uniref:TetR/AcrR family transcriptional regulator n=1 Tax=Kitasatospora herbaricolor TaxID=68217 RepID=UPI00174AC225|nr:TetR/AcrR family transcriptional regulator [Kitasatospora herbaricolor]MDQ0307251.1 AcrR family transcriptional regulator [Kitasatospora herbaricolor]GGV31498.1 TetR family transcriptional regulator [Kitasatospora herbaricolor]